MAIRKPSATRPIMRGYGLEDVTDPPGKRFPWTRVERLLRESRSYWVVTTRPGGRPHAVPVWGIWLDGTLVFDSGRDSVKTRNLRAHPDMVLHLESGEEAVIIEGHADELLDRRMRVRFAAAYRKKYEWAMDPDDPPGVLFVFRPRVGFSWREELGATATRWIFPEPE